jgi:hypothetical protein
MANWFSKVREGFSINSAGVIQKLYGLSFFLSLLFRLIIFTHLTWRLHSSIDHQTLVSLAFMTIHAFGREEDKNFLASYLFVAVCLFLYKIFCSKMSKTFYLFFFSPQRQGQKPENFKFCVCKIDESERWNYIVGWWTWLSGVQGI